MLRLFNFPYRRRPNPFNRGISENTHLFWKVYPNMQSNLESMRGLLHEDENKYYNKIYSKYGILYTQQATRSPENRFDDSDDEERAGGQQPPTEVREQLVQIY